jgi:hypothetical protein
MEKAKKGLPKEKKKRIKAWAVCFYFNKKCMQGDICAFNKRKEAKKYIVELHKKIGGFVDDHHIVPCEIHYKLTKKI